MKQLSYRMENHDLIKIENDKIESFVNSTPYPSYDEMVDNLENNIELDSEYGEENHYLCKKIYENPTNKQLIIDAGKQIFDAGGIQALLANHTIIKYFSPYWKSDDLQIKSQGSIIEHYFQSVTDEWKA